MLDDGGRKHTRQEIFAFFQTNRDIATRTEFLKSSYNDIWVEVLAGADKVRVGYHAEKDGLLMWEGSYLSRTAESVFSWGVVTEMTENLIERGAYKIKLGLQNAPVMAEQLSFFDMGGGAAVYEVPEPQRTGELFPIRTVPQAVIDQALYTAGNSYNSAYRVAVFYARQRSETECIAFLRREFGTENGRGIEYEGQKYAVWFMEDGIHLAQGDSIRTSHSRTTVTWEQASARILELLEAGTYLSAAELEQAREHTLLEMAEELMLTVRELTEEGRRKGLFAQTLVIHDQRKSYPELAEDVVAFAKGEGGLALLAEEYQDFLRAYEQDRSIMRFRLSEYSTHRIGVVLGGIDLPERSFAAQPDFLRRCKMFITQDEIDRFFLAESADSRLDVYAFFCYPHTKEEQQKFIKKCFGEYSGGGCDGYDYTIGMEFARRLFGDRYEVVIGTHLDKAHLHNHVVVNSVSFVDGKKYHSSPGSYYFDVRGVSDALCRENDLSTIAPQGKGKHYAEWKAEQKGKPTIRSIVRADIDRIIGEAYTYETFLMLLRREGYVVQNRLDCKYVTVLPPGGKRAIRLDSLGEGYTEQDIRRRLAAQREGRTLATHTFTHTGRRYRIKGRRPIGTQRKIKGFQALYLRYLYLLRGTRRKKHFRRVPFSVRQEVVRLERYDRQFRYLWANGMTTAEDLEQRIVALEREIYDGEQQRKPLYRERRDAEDEAYKTQCSAEIDRQTAALREKRRELALCRRILEDVPLVSRQVQQAEAERREEVRKEAQKREYQR